MRLASTGLLKRDGTPTWLFELLHSLILGQNETDQGFASIIRGEMPDGSGDSLVDKGLFFYKPGLPGGQLGFGAKEPSGILTFSSTANGTKGFIYLGTSDTRVAFDETECRIGIGTDTPSAKLHIVVGEPSNQFARPNHQTFRGFWVSEPGDGTTNIQNSVNETSPSDSGYIAHQDGLSTSVILGMNGVTDPGVLTGHVVRVRARYTGTITGSDKLNFELSSMSTTFWTGNTNGDDDSGRLLSNSFQTFIFTLSGAEVAVLQGLDYSDLTWSCFPNTALPDDGQFQISWVEFEVPATGGGAADVLQKWEAGSVVDILQFTGSSGDLDLKLSGPAGLLLAPDAGTYGLRIRSATVDALRVEDSDEVSLAGLTSAGNYYLTSGGAADKLYTSDSAGIGAWAYPRHAIAAFGARGPYQVKVGADGTWVSPVTGTIYSVKFWRETAGSSGSTILDLNKNGTTMYTTQANRPTITAANGNDFSATVALPDITSVTAGDKLSIDIDQKEGGSPLTFDLLVGIR